MSENETTVVETVKNTDEVVIPVSAAKPRRVGKFVGIGAGLLGGLLGALAFGFVAGSAWQADRTPAAHADGFNGRDTACVQVLRNGGVPRDCDRMYHLDFYP